MKFHRTCGCCGKISTAYTINLSESMLDAFRIFAKKYIDNDGWLRKWEIWLRNAQYSNFQNMKHFWIIIQESWLWYLTKIWWDFYNGIGFILNPAGFMDGKTLSDDHEARLTHKPRNKVTIHDIDKQFQDQKEKYQDEATKAKTVF